MLVVTQALQRIARVHGPQTRCLQVAAQDPSTANTVRRSLGDVSMLNIRLAEKGLPTASRVSSSIIQAISQGDTSPWPAVGAALACMAVLCIAAVAGMWWWRANQQHESEEERALRRAMDALRTRLGIHLCDGFAVGSEATTRGGNKQGWSAAAACKESKQRGVVMIQRSCLEAAGRLELRQVRMLYLMECRIFFCLHHFGSMLFPYPTLQL
jgi:hypothetical protein